MHENPHGGAAGINIPRARVSHSHGRSESGFSNYHSDDDCLHAPSEVSINALTFNIVNLKYLL